MYIYTRYSYQGKSWFHREKTFQNPNVPTIPPNKTRNIPILSKFPNHLSHFNYEYEYEYEYETLQPFNKYSPKSNHADL